LPSLPQVTASEEQGDRKMNRNLARSRSNLARFATGS